jgi:hypothetical protein
MGFNHLIDQCFMVRNIILKTSLIERKERFTLLLATSVKRTLLLITEEFQK